MQNALADQTSRICSDTGIVGFEAIAPDPGALTPSAFFTLDDR